jgi:hypothetical protein
MPASPFLKKPVNMKVKKIESFEHKSKRNLHKVVEEEKELERSPDLQEALVVDVQIEMLKEEVLAIEVESVERDCMDDYEARLSKT